MNETEQKSEPILKKAAKAIGKAVGSVAAVATHPAPTPKKSGAPAPAANGKLPPKNKQRLPRKLKKSRKKQQERLDAKHRATGSAS